jgi:branched-chain amino acid transport system substrate-binding protein
MDYNNAFLKAHTEYKEVPYQVAQASAAVQIWADAFRRAGTLDKEKLRDALAATDLATFYGQIRFAPDGRNIAKPMVLRQIQGGEYAVVAPTKVAAEKVVYPRVAAK